MEHPILEFIYFKLFNMENHEDPLDIINEALRNVGETDLIREQDIETGPFDDEGNICTYIIKCPVKLK